MAATVVGLLLSLVMSFQSIAELFASLDRVQYMLGSESAWVFLVWGRSQQRGPPNLVTQLLESSLFNLWGCQVSCLHGTQRPLGRPHEEERKWEECLLEARQQHRAGYSIDSQVAGRQREAGARLFHLREESRHLVVPSTTAAIAVPLADIINQT